LADLKPATHVYSFLTWVQSIVWTNDMSVGLLWN